MSDSDLVLQDADGDIYVDGKADDHGSYFVTVTDGTEVDEHDDDDVEALQPLEKRSRLDDSNDVVVENGLPSIQQILCDMNRSMCLRLDAIEKKLNTVDQRTRSLEQRLDQFSPKQTSPCSTYINSRDGYYPSMKTSSGAIIIGLPQEKGTDDDACEESSSNTDQQRFEDMTKSSAGFECSEFRNCFSSNVVLITLNTEADYPSGSWLGNENIPDQRVRVPISQSDLLHIESNCRTPEKMALALLDYLFDRDTQAFSNISGLGRHGKKKLDPLFVYGMRCHLVNRFGISEKDWHRIKLNIDSKCRTAFRRKRRGQSLNVKAFRSKSASTYMYVQVGGKQNDESDEDSALQAVNSSLHISQSGDVVEQGGLELAHNSQFQVITATPEQVARLKPRLQLLPDGQYVLQTGLDLAGSQDGGGVSLSTDDIINIVTTDSGELIQIMSEPDEHVTSRSSIETGIACPVSCSM